MGFTDVSCDKKCAVCGKGFVVLHQDLWRYRRGAKWLCSWSCLREYDKKKEERKLRKLTLEDKKKAVEIAVGGGDALAFLATKCDDPSQMWARIRNNVKDTDPETFAKLPKRVDKPKKAPAVEIPEVHTVEEAEAMVNDFFHPAETPEKPKITKPLNYGGFEVQKVRGKYASYDLGPKCSDGSQILTVDTGLEELSFDVNDWPEFLAEFVNARQILGVEL